MSRWLRACWPLALLLPPVAQGLEDRMALHMLLEFPLLLASGAAAQHLAVRRWPALARGWAAVDAHGLTGCTLLLSMSALWMIPAALDAALMSPVVQLAKVAGWWVTGVALAAGWRRVDEVLVFFVLGSLAWMAGSVGLLFHAAEQRLCANYLLDDQATAGTGLVLLSLGLAGMLLARMLRSARAA